MLPPALRPRGWSRFRDAYYAANVAVLASYVPLRNALGPPGGNDPAGGVSDKLFGYVRRGHVGAAEQSAGSERTGRFATTAAVR